MFARSLIVLTLAGCWSSSPARDKQPTPSSGPTAPVASADSPDTPSSPTEPTQADTPHLVTGDPPSNAIAEKPIPTAPPPVSDSSQAAIAARLNNDGAAAFAASKFDAATSKYREAVARVPEASYFFNLCLSLYREGRFDEALVACAAVSNNNPTSALETRTQKLRAAIVDEAKRQAITLKPYGY